MARFWSSLGYLLLAFVALASANCGESGQESKSTCTCPSGQVQQLYLDGDGKATYYCGDACTYGTGIKPGSNICKTCDDGSINDGTQKKCTACPSGYDSTDYHSQCTKHCPAGSGYIGNDNCEVCSSGLYSKGGQAACQYCPTGSIPNSARSACTRLCASGKLYLATEDSYTCVSSCPVRTQANSDGYCEGCPYTSVSAGGNDQCHYCNIAQHPNDDYSACLSYCPSGQIYYPYGAKPCYSKCPAGTYVYKDDEGGQICNTCSTGTVSTGGTVTSCQSCTGRTIANAAQSKCVYCASGTEPNGNHDVCNQSCKPGQTNNDLGACNDCGDGDVSDGGFAATCQHCDFGTGPSQDRKECVALCPGPGQIYVDNAPDGQKCQATCPPGTILNADRDPPICSGCDSGSVSPGGDTDTCTYCNAPAHPNDDSSMCVGDCPAGQVYAVTADQCVDSCPANTYRYSNLCYDCGADQGSAGGDDVCRYCFGSDKVYHDGECVDQCPPGSGFQSPNYCYDCNTSYQVSPGGNTEDNYCRSCDGSTEQPSDDHSTCVRTCPSGQVSLYDSNTGTSKCYDECPPGSQIGGPSYCDQCPSSQVSAGGSEVCRPCELPNVPAKDQSKCVLPPSPLARRRAKRDAASRVGISLAARNAGLARIAEDAKKRRNAVF